MISDGIQSYGYDAAGNQTSAGSNTFQFNALGQMSSSTVSGTTSSYAHNADGLRVASTTGSTTTPTVWDTAGGSPVPVLDGSESLVYAGSTPLKQLGGGSPGYLLTDALGSVRDIADGTGSVVGSASYNPYGTLAATSGTSSALGYTGAITDPTGLIYDQARYYNPANGQFTSPDSVIPNAAGSQGYNLYAYTAGNPVTLSDPTGHFGEEDIAASSWGQALDVTSIATFLGAIQVAEGAAALLSDAGIAEEGSISELEGPQIIPSPVPFSPPTGTTTRSGGSPEVLLDTNAVLSMRQARTQIAPGEQPVVTPTVVGEVAAMGLAKPQVFSGTIPVGVGIIPDSTNTLLIGRLLEELRRIGANEQGIHADAVIGAKAIEDRIPLITGDKPLLEAVPLLGGYVRSIVPGAQTPDVP